jgi:DNA-binding response OmpR family regulator
LLLVEDDDRVAAAQHDVLRRHGFDVVRAGTARAALDLLDDAVDVVLLDLGLPDRDGLEVCAQIRRTRDVPILVTTARGDLRSRVHGLNLGADDYLVKPYDVRELIARIHAVARRSTRQRPDDASSVIEVRGVRIDLGRREVCVADQPVALTRKEFDVLAILAREPGVVFRREQILSEVWESSAARSGHSLDVHVASLRLKAGVPELVETVRGVGYRLGIG